MYVYVTPTPTQEPGIIDYKWETSNWVHGDGGEDTGILSFENKGRTLSNVKFRFEFYRASGDLWATKYVDIGDVGNNEIKKVRVYFPSRYYGRETWTNEKIFIYIDGEWKEELFENI